MIADPGQRLFRSLLWCATVAALLLAGAGEGWRGRRVQLLPITLDHSQHPIIRADLDRA